MSMAAPRPTSTACTVRGPLARSDVGGLGARLRMLIEASGAQIVACDLDARVAADLVAVDALARLTLQARRLGCSMVLGTAPDGIEELLEFAGLAELVLAVEAGRQAEQREELVGVEEERELTDPPA
jgi:ABC-type transporter Mla MlaB component